MLISFSLLILKVLSADPLLFYKGELDIIVCFYTSKVKWEEKTDLLILPDQFNGLKKTSLIRTDKIATLEIELIIGKIGEVGEDKIHELDSKLKQLLTLD